MFNKVKPVFRSHKGQKRLMFPSPVEGCGEIPAFDNLFIESIGIHSQSENVLILGNHSIIIIIIIKDLSPQVNLKSLSSPKQS